MSWRYTKDLVSILTPCYNTGSIVHRLLDSILMQDYEHVEMIAVNDGSTDNTEEVLLSYKPKFEQRGYSFRYIYQENGGQSSAINNGLKFVTGEFLTWPDSDDYFANPSTISCFVEAFNNYLNYGVVRCLPIYVDENTLGVIRELPFREPYDNIEQFENCMYSRDFFWGAGDYFVRMSAFDAAIPSRTIYENKKAGQNWQMLMPVLYSSLCLTLKKHLFCVLDRCDSHSRRGEGSYEQLISKNRVYRDTILNTLDGMTAIPESNRSLYKTRIETQYAIKEYEFAVLFGHRKEAGEIKKSLFRKGVKIPLTRTLKLRLYSSRLLAQLQRFRRYFK